MSGPPVIDTSAGSHNVGIFNSTTASTSGTISTSGEAVILVYVVNSADAGATSANFTTVSSVTGAALTFAKYAGASVTGIAYNEITITPPFNYQGTGGMALELWWAHAPSPLVAQAFTATMSGTTRAGGIWVFAVYGCANPASPWDTNVSLPATSASAGGSTSVTVSTNSPNDLLLLGVADTNNPTANGNPDPVFSVASGGTLTAAAPDVVSSTGPTPGDLPSPSPGTAGYPGFDGFTLYGPLVTPAVSLALTVTPVATPLNAIVFVAGALVGINVTPAAVLSMGHVQVTSLTTESPCTVAQYTTPPSVSPAVGLRWSDTRGQTFGNAVPQALSDDPLSQLQWNRTGYARGRVFELFWSAAKKTALNGAFVEIEPWKS